jgi:carboxylate-amine ligase
VGRLLDGRVRVVNAFGVGVGDDKLAHAYVEDMVRYYLGEEPLVASVRTFDLGREEVLAEALNRLEELVVKPRAGYGGEGVVICPHAEPADVERIRSAVRDAPADYIAQELVPLSEHATVIDGELVPRHVDLRPFVFLGLSGEGRALPGGLTRVALEEGALVVNSSQKGGAKDTWIL